MCYHCFDVLIYCLRNGPQHGGGNPTQLVEGIPCTFATQLADPTTACPLFVTWEQSSRSSGIWKLRGCIGTLAPRRIVDAVGEYAQIAAFRDRRFRSIALHELESLRVAVSLLVKYEPCHDAYDWEVGVHGIIINFRVGQESYSGTYLPEVAKDQGWTIPQTITSLMEKAGYRGTVTSDLLKSIKCTRYQSSKTRVTFEEYIRDHCRGINPATVFLDSKSGDAGHTWQTCKPM